MEVVGIPKAWTPGTMVPDYHGTHLTEDASRAAAGEPLSGTGKLVAMLQSPP